MRYRQVWYLGRRRVQGKMGRFSVSYWVFEETAYPRIRASAEQIAVTFCHIMVSGQNRSPGRPNRVFWPQDLLDARNGRYHSSEGTYMIV